jgi:hypothetical protein
MSAEHMHVLYASKQSELAQLSWLPIHMFPPRLELRVGETMVGRNEMDCHMTGRT